MQKEAAFQHAAIVDTRWGQGLAFIDHNDDDVEVMTLRVWVPVCEDGSRGIVDMSIGLNPEASDEAHDLMSKNNRKAVTEMTGERFEAAFDAAGMGANLDRMIA